MKPTKKKAAKKRNPIVTKLLDLKYRINDTYAKTKSGELPLTLLGDTRIDKRWVMGQISALREGARLDAHQMKRANEIWRQYETR